MMNLKNRDNRIILKYFLLFGLITNSAGAMLQSLTKEEYRLINYAIRKMACIQGMCICPRHYYGCRYFSERLEYQYQINFQKLLEAEKQSNASDQK